MKFAYAVLISILFIIIQVSLIRLLALFPLAPNLSLVALFLLAYLLSYEEILILAIISGIAIDLASSASFGSTSLSLILSFSLSFYLRENIIKGGSYADFLLNNLITFFIFYFLLGEANIYLNSSMGHEAFPGLSDINFAGEILSNAAFGVLGYYLIKHYKCGKIYGFVKNLKISS